MLKMLVSDGQQKATALEYRYVPQLSSRQQPGIKVRRRCEGRGEEEERRTEEGRVMEIIIMVVFFVCRFE